jgi:hypothetical protein
MYWLSSPEPFSTRNNPERLRYHQQMTRFTKSAGEPFHGRNQYNYTGSPHFSQATAIRIIIEISYHLNFLGRERKTDYLVSLPSQKDEAQGMVCQEAAKGRS